MRCAPELFAPSAMPTDRTEAMPFDLSAALFPAEWQAILAHLPDPLVVCTADTTLSYASPSFARLLGHSEHGWGGTRLLGLIHPDDQEKLLDMVGQVIRDGAAPRVLAFRLRRGDGSWRQVEGRCCKLLMQSSAGCVLLSVRDVTGQCQEQQRITAEKKRQLHYLNRLLRLALHPHPNPESELKVILKAAAKALGTHRCAYWEVGAELPAPRCVMAYDDVRQNLVTEMPDAQLANAFHPLLQQVLIDEREMIVGDVDTDPRAAPGCEYFHAESVKALMILPVRNAGRVAGLLVVSHLQEPRVWRKDEAEFAGNCAGLISLIFQEVARTRPQVQPLQLTHLDNLTGLPNRDFLLDRAAALFPQVTAHPEPLAAFFIDLDSFRHVNDALGHEIGDELLKAVALRLKNLVRKDDILVRLGGDEFMLLAKKLDDMRIAGDIAQHIVDAMNDPFSLRGHELQISVSVGIALYPFDGNDIETLMKKADIALYHAKSGGRNQYRIFAPRQSNTERVEH